MDAESAEPGLSQAFGRPGLPPRWTRSRKEGLGTAYSAASKLWFTLSHGIVNEVYYPTVDSPQIRDLQYLVTDGETFFHEEKRDLKRELEPLNTHALGYRLINSDPRGRYRLVKEIIVDPHLPCLLMRTRLEGDEAFLKKLRLYALLAPRLSGRGWGNNAVKANAAGRDILLAYRDQTQLALGASVPLARASCGFVGASDGWTDLHQNFRLDWSFDSALDGNVAAVAQLDLSSCREFTLALAFGSAPHGAASVLLQSLAVPFERQKERFLEQWERACSGVPPLGEKSGDGGKLYRTSHSLLLAHEDKTYPGAMVASMSIPWGEARGDEDGLGGYHLVWTRDLCNSAGALLACGNFRTPLRALIYLAASQRAEGGFHQNFWIDGRPFWRGVQLDEAAFPVLLAWRLSRLRALEDFDPYPMVRKAAAFLIAQGPVTQQERWEENGGYSPSTLAACVCALVCAAQFARRRGEEAAARVMEDHADFLESHIEAWTVTSRGTLAPGIARHYIRILPADPSGDASEDPDTAILALKNVPPGQPSRFPAREIVDAGFLELVRYGLRRAGSALLEDSLRVVDSALKVQTPVGPCWRRYTHDGYGQKPDGGPFTGWGLGRPWPLLAGERGHYELAAGRDPGACLRALEGFASSGGMLPEQIWDGEDLPQLELRRGGPTGSAMPLMWAHAEYVKLLRSVEDGAVFDRLDVVAERYLAGKGRKDLEVWKAGRRPRRLAAPTTLRVQDAAPFRLHWSLDEWDTVRDTDSSSALAGVHFVDLAVPARAGRLRFAFYRVQERRWDGENFQVDFQ
ncbi:MAG: glucan 1,4-alpha-glucosidase, partial [Elusimicrobia bacterium]|nr:glucan 1,4-alpha-glucosidase [Elusimicrobiota bacterium]